MYATYYYSAAATQANILSDLVAILTGETDKNNLSASCNKTSTTITATVPAGWTLHDGSSGTNKKVIKALYQGSSTEYKYLEINVYSTTRFTVQMYETFNNSTHTGTNKTSNADATYDQYLDLTNGGKIYLFANARYCALVAETASWGDDSYGGIALATEFSPLCPWAAGYPAAALLMTGACFYGYEGAYLIRAKATTNADVLSGTSYWGTIGDNGQLTNSYGFPSGVTMKVYDNSNNPFVPFFPIFLMKPATYSMPIGDVSARADIWVAPLSMFNNLEETTKAGTTYIAVKAYTYTAGRTLLIPKQ